MNQIGMCQKADIAVFIYVLRYVAVGVDEQFCIDRMSTFITVVIGDLTEFDFMFMGF